MIQDQQPTSRKRFSFAFYENLSSARDRKTPIKMNQNFERLSHRQETFSRKENRHFYDEKWFLQTFENYLWYFRFIEVKRKFLTRLEKFDYRFFSHQVISFDNVGLKILATALRSEKKTTCQLKENIRRKWFKSIGVFFVTVKKIYFVESFRISIEEQTLLSRKKT